MFIVKIEGDFIEKARVFALELMKYKRDEENSTRNYLGDLDPQYQQNDIRSRYNINDEGDIYFINSKYANNCMRQAFRYKEDTRRESSGYQKRTVLDNIAKHHDYHTVFAIVEKYFEIA